jgi:hypothetical protein
LPGSESGLHQLDIRRCDQHLGGVEQRKAIARMRARRRSASGGLVVWPLKASALRGR